MTIQCHICGQPFYKRVNGKIVSFHDHTPEAIPNNHGSGNTMEPLPSGEQPTSVESQVKHILETHQNGTRHPFATKIWTKELLNLVAEERRQAKIEELGTLLKEVPMPTLSYEQVENRLAELKGDNTSE